MNVQLIDPYTNNIINNINYYTNNNINTYTSRYKVYGSTTRVFTIKFFTFEDDNFYVTQAYFLKQII